MELIGKVKWFDVRKGYGFIEVSDGGGDVFVHCSDVASQGRAESKTAGPPAELEPGESVRFEQGETPYGRRALRVQKVEPAPVGPC